MSSRSLKDGEYSATVVRDAVVGSGDDVSIRLDDNFDLVSERKRRIRSSSCNRTRPDRVFDRGNAGQKEDAEGEDTYRAGLRGPIQKGI